jgi:S1-C subfamily serine protease
MPGFRRSRIDSAGRPIAINSAIFSPSGAFTGIGFAAPVGTVRELIDALAGHSVGDRGELTIRRDGAIERIFVVLGRTTQDSGGVDMSRAAPRKNVRRLGTGPPLARSVRSEAFGT